MIKFNLKLKKCALIIGAALVTSSAIAGDLKVVSNTDLSGAWKEVGTDYVNGTELYFNLINKYQNGINGKKIVLIKKDNNFNADKAVEIVKEAASDSEVITITNMLGTGIMTKSVPVASSLKMPMVGAFTGAIFLADNGKYNNDRYVYNVRTDYSSEIENIFTHFAGFGMKRVAVIVTDNDGYGGFVKSVSPLIAKNVGVEIVNITTVSKEEKDFKVLAEKVNQSKPDFILFGSLPNSAEGFLNEYFKLTMKTQLVGLSPFTSSFVFSKFKEKSDGFVISQVVPSPEDVLIPIVEEFHKVNNHFDKKVNPTTSAIEGYIVGKTVVEGLKRSGANVTRESFVNALETFNKVDLGGFYLTFNKDKHIGSKWSTLIMVDKNGKVIN